MKKPVIGITCPWSVETWGDPIEVGGYFYVARAYVDAVYKYGGIPMLITPRYDESVTNDYIEPLLNIVDGLLFSGGGSAKRNPSEALPTLRGQQPIRYDFEAALLKKAYEKKLPIIGICRGFQMILEVFGGTLSDELVKHHKQTGPKYEPSHGVTVNKESMLYEIVGSENWDVNSIHIQQAEKVPEGFIISARATDGVIECIEAVDYPFLMGCQFHPEELLKKDKRAGEIFERFMQVAKKANQ